MTGQPLQVTTASISNCASSPISEFQDLRVGEVRVIDQDGNVISSTALTNVKTFSIVQGLGDGKYVHVTPHYKIDAIKEVSTSKAVLLREAAYVFAAVPNITKTYTVTASLPMDLRNTSTLEVMYKKEFVKDVTTQYEFAMGAVRAFQAPIDMVHTTLVPRVACYLTSGATPSAGGNLSAVNGQNSFVKSTGTVAAGDVVVVGSKLYPVKQVVNNFIELESIYVGTNGTKAYAVIPKATIEADATVGFVIEGISEYSASNLRKVDYIAEMILSYTGFTNVTETTFCNPSGYGKSVMKDEAVHSRLFQGFKQYDVDSRFETGLILAKADKMYSTINVQFEENVAASEIRSEKFTHVLRLYLERGSILDVKTDAARTAFNSNIQTGTGLSTVAGTSLLNVLNAILVQQKVVKAGANTKSNGGKEITAGTTFSTGIDC